KSVPMNPGPLPVRAQMKSKFSVPRLIVGFPTVRIGDDDQPALDVLEGVLAGGKRSRLYSSLVEGAAVASSVGADHNPGPYPGAMLVNVDLLPGKDRDSVEKLLLAELAKLRDEPVPAAELKRVQQQRIAGAIFSRESTGGLADGIGRAVTLADLEYAR